MSPSTVIPPPARTWRDIPQQVLPRAMSQEGRRRRGLAAAKAIGGVVLACMLCGIAYVTATIWQRNPTAITAPVKSSPLKKVNLRTDGVLDETWVRQTLAVPEGTSLMELDLPALQDRLMVTGQVRSAVVARKFPDTLTVKLEERTPVLRLAVRTGADDESLRTFVVARDGVVYSGIGYSEELETSLPYLDGVKLRRENGQFLPVEGMEKVAELLGAVHDNAPELYREFQSVSLERMSVDGEILVRSAAAACIVFGQREDFFRQIARLVYIIEQTSARPDPRVLGTINLAIGGNQVPVGLTAPTLAHAGPAPTRKPAPLVRRESALTSPLFSPPARNSSTRTTRDF